MRKRFIAGAICPACQQTDTLAMWRESNAEVVECVRCGHQLRAADKQRQESERRNEQVIGIFYPE